MATLSDLEIREYNEAVLMRIREICIRRNTSITKIEKALGYGNGSVSGWKNAKRKAPLERVVAIADFLDVPTMALTGESLQTENPALDNENGLDVETIKEAFRGRSFEELTELLAALTDELKNVK